MRSAPEDPEFNLEEWNRNWAAVEREMAANGGLITREDLKAYKAVRRTPVRGTYRGHEVISMPPPTSGGIAVIQALNILEGYDLRSMGYGSAAATHLLAESMRRAFADRAALLGDPDAVKDMPLDRLLSKPYAEGLRNTISRTRASTSSPDTPVNNSTASRTLPTA